MPIGTLYKVHWSLDFKTIQPQRYSLKLKVESKGRVLNRKDRCVDSRIKCEIKDQFHITIVNNSMLLGH